MSAPLAMAAGLLGGDAVASMATAPKPGEVHGGPVGIPLYRFDNGYVVTRLVNDDELYQVVQILYNREDNNPPWWTERLQHNEVTLIIWKGASPQGLVLLQHAPSLWFLHVIEPPQNLEHFARVLGVVPGEKIKPGAMLAFLELLRDITITVCLDWLELGSHQVGLHFRASARVPVELTDEESAELKALTDQVEWLWSPSFTSHVHDVFHKIHRRGMRGAAYNALGELRTTFPIVGSWGVSPLSINVAKTQISPEAPRGLGLEWTVKWLTSETTGPTLVETLFRAGYLVELGGFDTWIDAHVLPGEPTMALSAYLDLGDTPPPLMPVDIFIGVAETLGLR